MTGRSVVLDPRVNAVRADVADIALAGTLFAPHYAAAMARRCIAPTAAVRATPEPTGELISELLHGESFAVLDLSGDWAWGYCAHDHYVGYVDAAALDAGDAGDWRVTAACSAGLSMGAIVDGTIEGDALLTDFGPIPRTGLLGPGERAADPAALAERLLGTPYLLGGRSAQGIDCSGLVQVTLGLAGVAAPRDSDMQAERLGTALDPQAPLRRGDLAFFPGHVGMMLDDERLIHATGFHRQVAIEALDEVIARILGGDRAAMIARRP